MAILTALQETGLTGYEAQVYLALLSSGALTGYEAAKLSGISRSNVYMALEGLCDKGAANKVDGETAKYVPVPVEEYCANQERTHRERMAYIRAHAPAKKDTPDAYITIRGDDRILDKMKYLIEHAEKRIYLSMAEKVCQRVKSELETAIGRGVRVVAVSSDGFILPGAELHVTDKEEGQIRLITDSSYVLTGSLEQINTPASCLFTQNDTLITLFKEAMRHEIQLIRSTRVTKEG